MARRSSLEQLPPSVLEAVQAAIARGTTTDDIVAMLEEAGAPRSRSAVGRYRLQYSDLARQQKQVTAVAQAFAKDFGEGDNASGKLLIQLINSIAVRAVMPIASGEEVEMSGQEIHFLARAVKDLLSAAKIDTDRDEKVRDITKRAAAKAAEDEGRKSGADEETIRRIKSRILGIEI